MLRFLLMASTLVGTTAAPIKEDEHAVQASVSGKVSGKVFGGKIASVGDCAKVKLHVRKIPENFGLDLKEDLQDAMQGAYRGYCEDQFYFAAYGYLAGVPDTTHLVVPEDSCTSLCEASKFNKRDAFGPEMSQDIEDVMTATCIDACLYLKNPSVADAWVDEDDDSDDDSEEEDEADTAPEFDEDCVEMGKSLSNSNMFTVWGSQETKRYIAHAMKTAALAECTSLTHNPKLIFTGPFKNIDDTDCRHRCYEIHVRKIPQTFGMEHKSKVQYEIKSACYEKCKMIKAAGITLPELA